MTETEDPETDHERETASQAAAPEDLFEEQAVRGADTLVIDVDGFEGPLDLLLTLARDQKVDLTHISILALAEQYLVFIDRARSYRLEVAADYLVMAAWLAYLKSRLLLPEEEKDDDEPSGQELAAVLQFRLRRLEAMRDAARRLMNGNQLGRDVFGRGDPEPMQIREISRYTATMFDLLSAYAAQRQRNAVSTVHLRKRTVWSQAEAREILERLIGQAAEWTPISVFVSPYLTSENRTTALASSFSASLELAREGVLRLQQAGPLAPLYLRKTTAEEAMRARRPEEPADEIGPDAEPETGGDGEQTKRESD